MIEFKLLTDLWKCFQPWKQNAMRILHITPFENTWLLNCLHFHACIYLVCRTCAQLKTIDHFDTMSSITSSSLPSEESRSLSESPDFCGLEFSCACLARFASDFSSYQVNNNFQTQLKLSTKLSFSRSS